MESRPTVSEMTLDEMRPYLVEAMLGHVPFDGWGNAALDAAALDLGVNPASARLAFPDGAIDMIDAYTLWADTRMEESARSPGLGALKIRDRFHAVIRTRLEQATTHREAVRRALFILGLPVNAARAARIGWRTADSIWRAMDDRSTDFSYYTRRATAAAIYTATLLVWLDDESDDFTDTYAFLGRRIDDVMRFERMKAKIRTRSNIEHFSLLRFLGRIRYPVR